MNKQQRKELLRQKWGEHSVPELAVILGIAESTVKRYAKELGLRKQEISTDELLKLIRDRQEAKRERKHTDDLASRVLELEDQLRAVQDLQSHPTHYKILPTDGEDSEATAVMVASDWHIEEVVHEWQVSGLNEFDKRICRERVERFFRHGLQLVEKERRATRIDTLVLALLGDFISGSIHEELMEGNRLLPTFAVIEAQEHIASGIRYLLANSDLKLVIPCVSGNHSRMTKKTHVSTEAGNSLERLMYHSLAVMFRDEPRVKFVISDGYHVYVKVYDFPVRFHHGHSVRYYGGVGGITIPLNKAVAGWNQGRRAYLDVLGHFHSMLDGGTWVANGSLIGYSAFALSIKASPEPPRQAFFLIDREVGKTVVCPIILDRDR